MTKMRTRTKNKVSDENSNLKCKLDSKITKQKRSRQALSDRTNSGSDLNNSSPKQECTPKPKPIISTTRPKRAHQLPSRFKDHELSPVKSKKNNVQSTSTPLPTLPPTDNSFKIIQKLSPINEPTTIRTKKVSKIKTIERDKVSPNVPKETPSLKKFFTSNQSIKCSTPIYKKKAAENVQIESNKLTLYEFEFDPKNEPATVSKKKRQKRVPNNNNNPKKRKKILSRKSTEAAMKMLIEDLKKIQAENMMKRLVSKINSKKVVKVPIVTVNPTVDEAVAQIDETVAQIDEAVAQTDEVEDAMDRSLPSSPINFDAISAEEVNKDNEDEFIHNPMSSTRLSDKPVGSPWRMDLDSDVKKWRYNFYVKPSMTPAYERDTFHVLGLDDKEVRKDIRESAVATSTPNVKNTSKFKQTSILSFYEESFKKSPRKKVSSPKKNTPVKYNFDEYSQDESNDTEVVAAIVAEPTEKAAVEPNPEPAIENCFGFDEDIIDQENISPTKTPADLIAAKKTLRKLRNRRAPVLVETNQMLKGPARITTNQVKSILRREKKRASPKKTPVVEVVEESAVTTQSSDDSDNVNITEIVPENEMGLFEDLVDVDVVHYVKPTRRSYERRRRPPVRFQEVEQHAEDENESDTESPDRTNYVISAKTFKKRKAKKPVPKQMSKKEVKEAEEWAAGFNSMLEEVEEFPLCIE
ncbi:uncharacterized protein LOC143919018 isoform X2 [Arctopsyche grandis]|uniref:uncharacterized protein LOC143919018 isoform X2 n=1 Tax=Arctopsyche grandis TaxID=121162 RepID=UPI00406D8287